MPVILDMHMKDPVPTFSHLVEEIKRRQPNLAYLHVVTPNIELATPPTDKSVRIPHLELTKHSESLTRPCA